MAAREAEHYSSEGFSLRSPCKHCIHIYAAHIVQTTVADGMLWHDTSKCKGKHWIDNKYLTKPCPCPGYQHPEDDNDLPPSARGLCIVMEQDS